VGTRAFVRWEWRQLYMYDRSETARSNNVLNFISKVGRRRCWIERELCRPTYFIYLFLCSWFA